MATPARVLAALLLAAGTASAQILTQAAPGQPTVSATVGTFQIVGESVASAQQMFLGTLDKVYIVDKTENNPTQINGHPAWAAEYSVSKNTARPMDIITNSFCAGGNVLGNGTWVNAGGNQAVTYGGLTANSQTGGAPYDDPDGGQSLRLLDPCDDGSCDWVVHSDNAMATRRWYPTVETLEDGSVIILGGDEWGGYVNDASQNNPTYEFFPSRGAPVTNSIFETTLPANLYPITFLLPNGLLFMQLNWATVLLNYTSNDITTLDDVPDAVRTYPASAGTAMFPLTPENNYTATILFCGGANIQPDQWTQADFIVVQNPTSPSCVQITPQNSHSYVQQDPLPAGRTMPSLVLLPDGTILALNGANLGTAGYGNNSWAIGQSYADHPTTQPLLFTPSAPAGSRWSSAGMQASTINRMYHSTALLLPDGAVLVAGSNPSADYNVGAGVTYPTEYRVERFYPAYYNEKRPEPQGLPTQLAYGGPYFNVTLSSGDLGGNTASAANTTVVVIRPGFSTHAMSMGQRMVVLNSTYTVSSDGGVVLHVSQLPPNPAILVPGPALLFVVVDGVPSVGVEIMVGNGQLGAQTMSAAIDLPPTVVHADTGSGSGANSTSPPSSSSDKSGAAPVRPAASVLSVYVCAAAVLPALVAWAALLV